MTEDLITRTDEERKPNVLFVDDDIRLLSRYCEVAEETGYNVTAAVSVEAALQHQSREFDIATFDGLEGRCFDLYEKIKAKRKIIMTGDCEILRRAKKRNIEAYLKSETNLYNLLSEWKHK